MLWRAKKESTACGIGRQSLTSQQNRLAVWAAPLGSGSRGAMDLVAGPRGLSLDLWCGRQHGSRIIRYSAIKNDSGAIPSSEVDASHISVRTLGSQFHEFWQATAPGIKRGLSWSGVPDQHGIPDRLSAPCKAAVAAKTTSFETTVAVRVVEEPPDSAESKTF